VRTEVSTQLEFDAAIKRGETAICVRGQFNVTTVGGEMPTIEIRTGVNLHLVAQGSSRPRVVAWGASQPHVKAWESSQPHVVAWESSQPHVVARESSEPFIEAWGSSQPHVEARESSQPRIEARESSQPHIVAWGASQPLVDAWGTSQPHVVAWESSQPFIRASAYVQISLRGRLIAKLGRLVSARIHGKGPQVEGGHQTYVIIETPEQWCDYYGATVAEGVATLYKAVDEDYSTGNARLGGIFYRPGTAPVAPDWDGGVRERGGGLHFAPRPEMAMTFNVGATKFVACPVALKDFSVQPDAEYPDKIKASGCCGPVYEVDRRGNPVRKQGA